MLLCCARTEVVGRGPLQRAQQQSVRPASLDLRPPRSLKPPQGSPRRPARARRAPADAPCMLCCSRGHWAILLRAVERARHEAG